MLAGAGALAAGAVAWGCRGQPRDRAAPTPEAPRSAGETLRLYAPARAGLAPLLGEAFARASSSVVDLLPVGGPGAVFQALREDLESGAPQADVVFQEGPYAFWLLERHGLLSRRGGEDGGSASGGELPAHWRRLAPLAFTVLGRGFPSPSSFDLLALPQRAVPLVILDPGQWDGGTMLVLAVLDWFRHREGDFERGWQFLEQVLASPFRQAASLEQVKASLQGSQPVIALLPDDLASVLLPDLPGAWRAWPEQMLLLPNFAAEVERAPHPALAEQFLAWLDSAEAHQVMAAAGRLPPPCAHELPACQAARALAARATPLDIEWGVGKYNEVRREWQRRFWKD